MTISAHTSHGTLSESINNREKGEVWKCGDGTETGGGEGILLLFTFRKQSRYRRYIYLVDTVDNILDIPCCVPRMSSVVVFWMWRGFPDEWWPP